MALWVDNVTACAKHGDRLSSCNDTRTLGVCVNAKCHAADYHQPCLAKFTGKQRRRFKPGRGCSPTPDNRYRGSR